jgi:hypothetical protein
MGVQSAHHYEVGIEVKWNTMIHAGLVSDYTILRILFKSHSYGLDTNDLGSVLSIECARVIRTSASQI